MTTNAASPSSLWRQLYQWAARIGLENKLAVVLIFAAVASGIATYTALSSNSLFGKDADRVSLLLVLDLTILLMLGAIVARRLVGIWAARRRGSAGSRLHVRLVALFAVVAVAPAILVAIFSAVIFNIGVQTWFSERVSTAVNESLSVAQVYLEENQKSIRYAAQSIAYTVERAYAQYPEFISGNRSALVGILSSMTSTYGIPDIRIIDRKGQVVAESAFAKGLKLEMVGQEHFERATSGDAGYGPVELIVDSQGDRVRALVRLNGFPFEAFLLIGKQVDPEALAYVEQTKGAVADYRALEGRRSQLQLIFTAIYVTVAVLLLMAAVWIGLVFADTLVRPLRELIMASERVRAGDLSIRVQGSDSTDELGSLARSFNRMTNQLESQRRELIEANRQLDQRRQFTETVLSGVSAGVLGLDHDGRVHLPNRSATDLLGRTVDELVGQPLESAVPGMKELLESARSRQGRGVEGQVKIRRHGELRTLLARIAAERLDGEIQGFVVTFDDVTELLSAQRKAAWADVARRIAHEIKNPLTPIQLSAERLKRKYLKQISDDPQTFITCIETIVRQVGDIGRMVDEFSAFARMPSPVMKAIDLSETCQQAIFLQRNAHPKIGFAFSQPDDRPLVPCDSRQLSQAVTNLLQNAADAIEGRIAEGRELPKGQVRMVLDYADGEAWITVEDNGKGLPTVDRDRLTEPYVTTRTKGTGLGLAIVKKIMEDHGGRLVLEDRPGGGARVSLVFPLEQAGVPAVPTGDEPDASTDRVTAAGSKDAVGHGA
ncbi:PAS domain-containing sensor histidine kinase [Inquilinus sp. Marseille-Q2685]|uniref:sensor histidine kinase NtrY-like n=1 Tax=Inquilinus sp. Marseille-Q2685 TaxID=2866581 RepID=UPI001CE4B3BE|nr:PAS domain-containing sensor histidine kinase [Inquilinus sp. Marseille-Q2685]